MEEIEVKYLNIDPDEIQKKLAGIGAVKVGEFFQRWKAFDYPDWRLDKQGAWLRLRDEGDGTTTLTFKQRLGIAGNDGIENDIGMEEIEIHVDDFDTIVTIFVKIGFVEKHYAEKKRTRWEKDSIEFDVDTYPELEPYLEIEAPSWEKIDEAILWLGLDPGARKIFSANQVYALKNINVADYTRIAFDGLIKKDSVF
jgi:adenylate cyclase class 2